MLCAAMLATSMTLWDGALCVESGGNLGILGVIPAGAMLVLRVESAGAGSIDEIVIESGGSGYSVGEELKFNLICLKIVTSLLNLLLHY